MEKSVYKVLLRDANEVVYSSELYDTDDAADACSAAGLLTEKEYQEICAIILVRLTKINRLIDDHIALQEGGRSREDLYFSDPLDRDDIERKIFE